MVDSANDRGFDYSFLALHGVYRSPYMYFENSQIVGDPADLVHWEPGNYGASTILNSGIGLPNWDSTEVEAILLEKALNFISSTHDANPDNPFFLYYALPAIHNPHTPPEDLAGMTVTGSSGLGKKADMVRAVDIVVGQVMTALEQLEILDETLIIFSSDNGGYRPAEELNAGHDASGGLKGSKASIFEGGHRVPLIMRWGDGSDSGSYIVPGSSSNTLTGIHDLVATVSQLVGVHLPENQAMDSVSLHPILFSNEPAEQSHRNTLLTISNRDFDLNVLPKNEFYYAFREGDWKLIVHFTKTEPNNAVPKGLFDLNADIMEEVNLLEDPSQAERIERMLAQFIAMRGSSRTAELYLVDIDDDGVGDTSDNCPLTGNSSQQDVDSDGVGDFCDAFVNDPLESSDHDGDGIGDNADSDDDNDGITDSLEIANHLDPLDAELDFDGDGLSNLDELTLYHTDPNDADSPSNWFEDASFAAGINTSSQTFGVSWGDLNGDGWPDVYVSNHWQTPSLYLNQRDGTFSEEHSQHDLLLGNRDVHGAQWADFDNDGDQDLIAAPGGTNGVLPFYQNIDGTLNLFAHEDTKLDWIHSDRQPLWFDQNGDGLLDLLMTSVGKTEDSAFFQQTKSHQFINRSSDVNFIDIPGSGARLIKSGFGNYPHVMLDYGLIYDTSGSQWRDITNELFGIQRAGTDNLHGDIDGDGCFDIYTVKLGVSYQVLQSNHDTLLEISSRSYAGEVSGFDFSGGTSLSIITGLSLGWKSIRLGANAELYEEQALDLPIVVDKDDARIFGEPVVELNTRALLYIWVDLDSNQWHMRWGDSERRRSIDMSIESDVSISNLELINVDLEYSPQRNLFRKGSCDDSYTEATSPIAFTGPSISGVLADFDNDMDLDLYLTNLNRLDNPPNQLFENLGDGNFIELPYASGAAGSDLGNGGYVASADYDLDGFLDLFVLNGRTDFVAGGEYDGPHQLFHNNGNNNNWIQIDLEGTESNRDAIGALVELYAGGKRQIRYQDNGAHTFSQNFKRLHFGLGQNEKVDKIVVTWPSGQKSKVINIRGNQIIRVRENRHLFIKGEPIDYSLGRPGIYLWKDSYDGPFKLRVIGDGSNSEIQISSISTAVPSSIIGVDLETNDQIDNYPYGFRFISNEGIGVDGVDFTVAPDSETIMSVEVDGNTSLHRLTNGKTEYSPLPEAWVLDVSSIQLRPDFDWHSDVGFFIGTNIDGSEMEYRWSGAEKLHMYKLSILTSNDANLVKPASLEGGDTLSSSLNRVEVNSAVVRGFDGVDIDVTSIPFVAFSALQDGLFTPENFNKGRAYALKPNAFWLDYPSFIGEAPVYDAWLEAGMFIWRDLEDIWHIRTTAGGGFSRFKGKILASSPIDYLKLLNIEGHDTINQPDSNTIEFDMQVGRGWYDGIDFKLVTPGSIIVKDTNDSDNLIDYSLFLGPQKWPVLRLPVTLNKKTESSEWYGPQE